MDEDNLTICFNYLNNSDHLSLVLTFNLKNIIKIPIKNIISQIIILMLLYTLI